MTYQRTLRVLCETADGETVITTATTTGFAGREPRGVIFCHGSGDNALSTLTRTDMRGMIRDLARNGVTQSADWALQAFGNDACGTAIYNGIQRLRTTWGVMGPVALVGVSMGGCSVLNYAVRQPDDVACVAAVIGLTDLGALYDTHPEYQAEIDAAYGGSFDEADRASHSPIEEVDSFPADMPISLWTSTNDPLVLPAWHAAFKAARPQTEQFLMGDHGHGFAPENSVDVAAWVAAH